MDKEIFLNQDCIYLSNKLTGYYVLEDKELHTKGIMIRDYQIKNLYTKNFQRVTSIGDFVNKKLVKIDNKPIEAFIEDYEYTTIGHITDKFFVSFGPSNVDSIDSTFFVACSFKSILIEINDKYTRLKHAIEFDKRWEPECEITIYKNHKFN